MKDDRKQLLDVNDAFYEAFAAGNFPALKSLWSGSDDISVIHPGNDVLHGRKAVMESWQQILSSDGSDIRCVNPVPYVLGNSAYVICHEVFPRGKLIATNIFVREEETWRMVHHQAGPDTSTRHERETGTALH